MSTRRTSSQWQQLLAKRATFGGTNIEFCDHYNISITSFYKQQAMVRQQTGANFIQVTTMEQTQRTSLSDNPPITLDVHSGELKLPSTMAASQIIAIVKGLV